MGTTYMDKLLGLVLTFLWNGFRKTFKMKEQTINFQIQELSRIPEKLDRKSLKDKKTNLSKYRLFRFIFQKI